MIDPQNRFKKLPCGMCLLLAVLLAGCGGESGPHRHALEGAVTFDGQPVPHGEIMFSPDSSKGNTGPGSLASIENGKYATNPGQGILGGAYVLEVSGYEPGEMSEDGVPEMHRLFPTYTIEAELPSSGGTYDIDVPAEAAGSR